MLCTSTAEKLDKLNLAEGLNHIEKGNLKLISQAELNQGLVTPEGHLKNLLSTPERRVPDEDLSISDPSHPEYLQLHDHNDKIVVNALQVNTITSV